MGDGMVLQKDTINFYRCRNRFPSLSEKLRSVWLSIWSGAWRQAWGVRFCNYLSYYKPAKVGGTHLKSNLSVLNGLTSRPQTSVPYAYFSSSLQL